MPSGVYAILQSSQEHHPQKYRYPFTNKSSSDTTARRSSSSALQQQSLLELAFQEEICLTDLRIGCTPCFDKKE